MKKIIVGITLVLVLIITLGFVQSSDRQQNENNKVTTSSSGAIGLRDAHGLAVDRQDSTKVYIATHTGLLQMTNEGDFQRVGNAQDDYMGFSAHPKDPNIFFSSGHPSKGGNIGFQKSTDGGKTWQKISNGIGGPVDFHTMTVSVADPNIIYGVYRGQLQRSSDEGKTWEVVNTSISNIITLSTDVTKGDTVYAGTTDGLYVSQNRGSEWNKINGISGAVTAVAIHPKDSQNITVYADNQGLLRTTDGGTTWTALKGYSGNKVMHIASDMQNPSTSYLINQALEIHKTTDAGETWSKVR